MHTNKTVNLKFFKGIKYMNKNIKYKNIIFDLGGVLVNWKPKEIIEDIFKNKKIEQPKNWQSIISSDIFKNLEKGIISRKEAIKKIPEKTLQKQFLYLFEKISDYLFPLKAGLEILDKIKTKKYNLYVLSNFQEEIFNQVAHNYNFLKDFDGIILSFNVKSMKPEPKIYHTLLNNYSLKPQECIFIDDMEENIIGAKKVGIDGIICKNHSYVLGELKKLNIL